MDDPAVVGFRQGGGQFEDDFGCRPGIDGLVGVDQLRQRRPLDEPHDDEVVPLKLADIVDGADVGVAQFPPDRASRKKRLTWSGVSKAPRRGILTATSRSNCLS